MTLFIKEPSEGFNSCMASALRARRGQVQMTYAELAEAAGVPEVSLIRILTEKRAINFSQVAALAEAMNTTVQEIVEEAERESLRRHGNTFGYEPQVQALAAHDAGYDPDEEAQATQDTP